MTRCGFDATRLAEIWRYCQAGAANVLFGFGAYACFVWLGFGIYAAQILGHLLGVAFNYLTYSRHVFRVSGPAKLRFVGVYGVNYLISLAALGLADLVVRSPYLAGLIAIVLAAAINYFLLKHIVFVAKAER